MSRLSPDALEKIIENEKEWRRYIVTKVEKIEADNKHLHVKVSGIAGIFSVITTFITSSIKDKIGG